MRTRPLRSSVIGDPAAFHQLLRDTIAHFGTVSAAAREGNARLPDDDTLDRSQLQRLQAGQHGGRLQPKTARWLARLVRALPGGPRRLQQALLPPAHAARVAAYGRWVTRTRLKLATGKGEPGQLGFSNAEVARGEYLLQLVATARRDKVLRSYFTAFDNAADRAQASSERRRLAEIRAFAPFAAAVDTEGMERRWEELSESERCEFLRAALRCEAILLNRAGEYQRAQQQPWHQLEREPSLGEVKDFLRREAAKPRSTPPEQAGGRRGRKSARMATRRPRAP